MDQTIPLSWYLAISAVLFGMGALGVLIRRNPLIIFMSVELMLNAANLAFVAFARSFGALTGQIFVFFVMTVAAAEVAAFPREYAQEPAMAHLGGPDGLETTPPHDISGKEINDYLPKGKGSDKLVQLMNSSQMLLKDHSVNIKREEEGHKPANSIWLWGQGRKPDMPTLKERFGIKGSIISAVDLVKGVGIYGGLNIVNVPGATGYIDTNYRGKAEYALK